MSSARMLSRGSLGVLVAASLLLVGACAYRHEGLDRGQAFAARHFTDRPNVVHPADNPPTPAKVALGRDLFNDARLSADGARSCASCHRADRGFGDGVARAPARSGGQLLRHTPTIWNVAHAPSLFWDGRAPTLEAQALMPVMAGEELGRHPAALIDPIRADAGYRARFAASFPEEPEISEATVSKAIAAYERTLVSGTAPFDRWAAGDAKAISPAAQRGFAVFAGPGNCVACHRGAMFTDGRFKDIGLPDADLGRGGITGNRLRDHAFRTPSLREIGQTAPYMHDGSLPTLAAVVDHYSDRLVERPLGARRVQLSPDQKRDLVAFLHTLDSDPSPAGDD
ncbi:MULTISPECIES: cytochrome-c peroxidase [unclassified Sphingomonas]|uniref:cytochrome-c peroxidase n=1 Tax=unclassified Sphingomonas TaxID=196159 RepID=UPI00082D3BDB|nr:MULTISPECIES: cytochrome c peroxidase [unclassified Sphingomonas]